ncbi:MAG: hypothetical protein OCD01_02225 [Fibrobacterales bacterium]
MAEAILEVFLHIFCYWTGKLLIPVVSGYQCFAAPFEKQFKLGKLLIKRDNKYFFESTLVIFLGFIFWGIVAYIVWALNR